MTPSIKQILNDVINEAERRFMLSLHQPVLVPEVIKDIPTRTLIVLETLGKNAPDRLSELLSEELSNRLDKAIDE